MAKLANKGKGLQPERSERQADQVGVAKLVIRKGFYTLLLEPSADCSHFRST